MAIIGRCVQSISWLKEKPINNKKLAAAIGNVAINKDGKPKKVEILESIVSDISRLGKITTC